jgi:predicted ABC-type ATPase
MSRLTWPASRIGFSPADTTFRELDVRRRYTRSFENLLAAISRADHTILFDNSSEEGYRLVAVLGPPENQWIDPAPAWAAAMKL